MFYTFRLPRRAALAGITLALSASLACGQSVQAVDIADVPVGADVTIVRQDGGVVQGTLAERTPEIVRIDDSVSVRTVERSDISLVQLADPSAPEAPPLPAIAKFREYTVPAGTELSLRVDTGVSSKASRAGDAIRATVTQAIVQGDVTIVPAGSELSGEITAAEPSGKVKGRARLALAFRSLAVEGHDAPYAIAADWSAVAASTKTDDAAKIGVPAVGGAVVGGMLGGRKGAIIGGVVGGGAGTAVVLTTAGDEVEVPAGTSLRLTLDHAVVVRVPID